MSSNPPNANTKPAKSILKRPSVVGQEGTQGANQQQQQHIESTRATFDEMNIIETLHPADKDYGHMKIDEPKTPYNYASNVPTGSGGLNALSLIEKLNEATGSPPRAARKGSGSSISIQGGDDDGPSSSDPAKSEFIAKRKSHYNEFQAIQKARALMEEEPASDNEEENGPQSEGKQCSAGSTGKRND